MTYGERLKAFVRHLRRDRELLLIIAPVVLFYALFCYLPMYGIVIAFKDFNISRGVLGSEWVGLDHFRRLTNSFYFPRLLKNTMLISLEQLLIGFPIPIIFALLLNEVRRGRFKKLVQTASCLPHFISMVVVVAIMMDLFSRDGLVNQFLQLTGIAHPIAFFNEPSWFRTLFVGSNIWQDFGWNAIVYLAAISSINPELYEAAIVDGAGRWKQLLHVTLPGIAPTIIVLLILNMGWMFSVGHEKIILMYNPATYETADVLSTYVYRKGLLDAQYSFAAAAGLLNSVINIVILISANFLAKKFSSTSIF